MEQLYLLQFQKQEKARFLSHLDMARLFIRAFRRAKLPLKFSEGFHAHPKVRFSPPLSVGVESLEESCLFTLLDETRDTETLLDAISEGMADGFILTSLSPIEKKPTPLPKTRYEITFRASAEALKRAFVAPMTVVKRTKSGEKEIDLFPHLVSEEITELPGGAKITLLAPSTEELTVNPNLICTALQAKDPTLKPVRILKICAVEN